MVNCRSPELRRPSDRRLCEWYVRKTGQPPRALDTGDTYVDLTDSDHPEINKDRPDGKISQRELYSATNRFLEREWQKLFSNPSLLIQKKSQPIAEQLYDRFDFLPPWLPKPLARMSASEKRLFRNFLVSMEYRGTTEAIHQYLRYVGTDAIVEDDFFGILAEGATGCVGMSNLDYFAEKIVKRREVNFVEFYREHNGRQQAHIGVLLGRQPYDPSIKTVINGEFDWFVIDPMDQWAVSLIKTGSSKMNANQIDEERYARHYLFRAYDFAPDYFRVQVRLGEALYAVGLKASGIEFLKLAKLIYPDFQQLDEWEDLLTP